MATPGKRADAPTGVTVDEGTIGRRGATGAALDAPTTVPRDAMPGGATPIVIGAPGGTTVRIEITITTAPVSPPPDVALDTTNAIERNIQPWHDASYGDRKGYDPAFLEVRVPMPRATSSRVVAKQENGTGVLPYQHFSIVMHKTRRLALCTAANLDFGPRATRPDPTKSYSRLALGGLGPSDREVWFSDPRLPAAHQLSDRFFDRDGGAFDKGHVVMRDSIAWGRTYTMLRRANGDSYHVTNCTPQVKGFNQASQQGRWGKLENAISKQAKGERVSVFAGPVLSDDDWWFEGEEEDGQPLRLQIPSRFWKVIVGVGDDDALVAYGFLLTQDLDRVPLSEEFGFDVSAWRDEFVSIPELVRATKLVRFPEAVVKADQFGTAGGQETARALSF